ncbi:MAG: class I SAM-dependent methyltransferase [Candidatus Helarchaeota archaeon]|nr:class I SAM-dependent methyltransferase [Candidatus Helarchaeota archaeon]
MGNFSFRGMEFLFKIRDRFHSPVKKIVEAELKSGMQVLDFGCGPGSYSIAAAEVVGETGKVYAVDIHPLAIERVQQRALKKGLKNIEAIRTDCQTGLPNNSLDLILMFDVFHQLKNPDSILGELARILKPNAYLALDDHHMKEAEILSNVSSRGLFKLFARKKLIYLFVKT